MTAIACKAAALLALLAAFWTVLVAGFGGFGWPTDPHWLILTIPAAVATAAGILTLLGKVVE